MSRRISEPVLLQKYEERNQELYKENIMLKKKLKEREQAAIKERAKLWQEIKALEQEYKRNTLTIQGIEGRQSDISIEIQKRITRICDNCG